MLKSIRLSCESTPPTADTSGVAADVFRQLATLATDALSAVRSHMSGPEMRLGRIRGTGPGASLGRVVDQLRNGHPRELESPFEGSDRVSGAVWKAQDFALAEHDQAIALLRWEERADDLPMHTHEHSDRFIIVLEGRGFFHASSQSLEAFDGSDVRTIAARERDVFVFRRDVVHTFSTHQSPMTLLSFQSPFLEFDDPRQYRLPSLRWTASRFLNPDEGEIVLDFSEMRI